MSKISKGLIALFVITCMLVAAVPSFAADADAIGFDYTVIDFESNPFESANQVEELAVEDGVLYGKAVGGDPFMNASGISLPADMIAEIRIRMYVDSDSSAFQFFFTTDTIGWSEDASFRVDLSEYEADEDGFIEFVIDTSTCAQWIGTITNYRVDPMAGEGLFGLDYIVFWSDRFTVAKVDFADYEVAPFDAQNIAKLFVEDGYLYCLTKLDTADRIDPYMNFNAGISLNADAIGAIHFRFKTFNADAANGYIQFFFTTETVGWSESASFKVNVADCEKDDYGWYYAEIDTSASADWTGTITNFRLDPVEANGVFVCCSINFDGALYSELDEDAVTEAIEELKTDEEKAGKTGLDFAALRFLITESKNGFYFRHVNSPLNFGHILFF